MTDPRFILKPVAYQWAWGIALAVYLVAFVLPIEIGPRGEYASGFSIFWLGMLYCWIPMCFPWWANLFFWLALGQSGERPTAASFVLAVIAFLLAGSFYFIVSPGGGMLGPAYWAWAGSMGVLAVGLGVTLLPRVEQRPIEDESPDRPLPISAPDDDRIMNPPR